MRPDSEDGTVDDAEGGAAPDNSKAATPSLRRRLICLIYESLLVLGLLLIAGLLVSNARSGVLEGTDRILFQCYLLSVLGIYFCWYWSRTGQTLPMQTWRIALVCRDQKPLSARQAIGRFLLAGLAYGSSLAGLLMLWKNLFPPYGWVMLTPGIVSLLWAIVDEDRQFLHDRLSGTRLVLKPHP